MNTHPSLLWMTVSGVAISDIWNCCLALYPLKLLWVSSNYLEQLPIHPSLQITSLFPLFCWICLRSRYAVKPQPDISYVGPFGHCIWGGSVWMRPDPLSTSLSLRCSICVIGAATAPALRSIWCPPLVWSCSMTCPWRRDAFTVPKHVGPSGQSICITTIDTIVFSDLGIFVFLHYVHCALFVSL